MFTGIIETLGRVVDITHCSGNIKLEIEASFANELSINQSVAHNGACLSVTSIGKDSYSVTMIEETLSKTALGELKKNDLVNLERSMTANGRFDGHMVLGHVDSVATCISIEKKEGSTIFTFRYPVNTDFYTVEKGSITVNGISLTVVNSTQNEFSVAIIPYTLQHTNLQFLSINSKVNLEFDILGKYIKRLMQK